MFRAAGVVIISLDSARILLNMRSDKTSHSGTWSFLGGMINKPETLIAGLSRELYEEMGALPGIISAKPLDVFNSPDGNFQYFTMLVIVKKEFIPNLNNESDSYAWCKIGKWPKPLHTGAKKLLNNQQLCNNILKLISLQREIKDQDHIIQSNQQELPPEF